MRAWTLRTLEKAGEKVADVQGEDEEEDVEPQPAATQADQPTPEVPPTETRKDQ